MTSAEEQINLFKQEVSKQVNEHKTRKQLVLEQGRVLYYLTELNHKLWLLEEEPLDEKEELSKKNQEENKESSLAEAESVSKKK